MATTGKDVFDLAIHLMDEQNEATGATVTSDTNEYLLRTKSILNVLKHEVWTASDTFVGQTEDGRRAVCTYINDLDDDLDLDDAVAQGALPYGLASRLLLGENDALANFFEQKYLELMAQLRSTKGATWEDIPLAYSLDV